MARESIGHAEAPEEGKFERKEKFKESKLKGRSEEKAQSSKLKAQGKAPFDSSRKELERNGARENIREFVRE
jgi:hypothetical protein